MRKFVAAALPALLLVGCGGDGEDFSVEVKRSPAVVYRPLSAVDIHEARALFPGIEVNRSRESDTEILYTMPGEGNDGSTVRLRLEPLKDGTSTAIHASVDVPAVRASIDGVEKVLSEGKIETALRGILQSTAQNLEMGSTAQSDSEQLSALLLAVAIGTNPKYLDRALALKDDPESLAAVLGAFGSLDAGADAPGGDLDRAMDNPEDAYSAADAELARSEWEQEEAMREAAEPMDEASFE